MLGRGAAAAAHHIDEPAGREFAEDCSRLLRSFVVFAECIRQTRVRVGAYVGIRDSRQFLDIRTQLFASERAIETYDGGPGVTYGIPERLGGLARQGPTRRVADRARHD